MSYLLGREVQPGRGSPAKLLAQLPLVLRKGPPSLLTHSFTHSFIYSPTHSLTPRFSRAPYTGATPLTAEQTLISKTRLLGPRPQGKKQSL